MIRLKFAVLDINGLTGSVPLEIAKNTLLDLGIYDNELSDLIPVDGKVICSADNSTNGDHYCDCTNHCLVQPPVFIDRCTCQEGKACCSSFVEKHTECKICQGRFENPDTWIPAHNKICSEFFSHVMRSVKDYGSKDQCAGIELRAQDLGCICKDAMGCNVCENGIENPDFLIEEHDHTCEEANTFIMKETQIFSTEEECEERRDFFLSRGCKCKSEDIEISQCIVCEFGLENPEFSVDTKFFQTPCLNTTEYIKTDIEDYGTEEKCDEARMHLLSAGCSCKETSSDLVLKEENVGV